ncbi:MAG: hypothetical protein HY868_02430 [Chloroflexi bacterium]|nr:hypothetical protein [Chloroflexota bacterium]
MPKSRASKPRLDDEWVSRFPFKTKPRDVVHLPIECVVYVPSTLFDKRIPKRVFQKRIRKTADELVRLFGGCRETMVRGHYMDRRGEIIEEDIAVLTGYGKGDHYLDKREQFLAWLLAKKKEWQQESIGFEFEGDLWYI